MYSQNDEEKYILEYFGEKKDGRFLDLGAYDGLTFSNVRALAERGWSGVCVEASPQCFVKLQENMKPFPQVQLICAAVSRLQTGIIKFFDSAGAVGSTSEEHYEKWKPHQDDFSEIYVAQAPLFQLREMGPFDFVSVDLEGTSYHVLGEILEHPKLPQMICIEVDEGQDLPEKVYPMLWAQYRMIARTAENAIYAL